MIRARDLCTAISNNFNALEFQRVWPMTNGEMPNQVG